MKDNFSKLIIVILSGFIALFLITGSIKITELLGIGNESRVTSILFFLLLSCGGVTCLCAMVWDIAIYGNKEPKPVNRLNETIEDKNRELIPQPFNAAKITGDKEDLFI